MPNALVDTGFWIALLDDRDTHHVEAERTWDTLSLLTIVIAWPLLYETLNTRLARNSIALRRFEQLLARPSSRRLDDAPYRQDALDIMFRSSLGQSSRPLSLVDCVLRLALEDIDTRIDYLVTFNIGDFADVCRRRRVQLR